MTYRSFLRLFGGAIVIAFMMLGGPMAPQAEGAFPIFPSFFFPIDDCGTVAAFSTVDQDGSVEVQCLYWKADSGGSYTFGGIDVYEVGDRVHVNGQICFVCLSTCPAGTPLINAVHMPCE